MKNRLFDCLADQPGELPLEDMLAAKENGTWRKYSKKEVQQTVTALGAGLLHLGIDGGDMTEEARSKVAVVAKNRPEWIMLDLAVQQTGAVLTPVYPTINASELEFIFNDAQVKLVFVDNIDLYHKVLSIKANVPSLQEIYSFEEIEGVKSWKEVVAAATPAAIEKLRQIAAGIKGEDLATIIYTSGTTGKPKGVMLSHRNICSNVEASFPCLPDFKDMRALSFLPLNHIFERMITYFYLFKHTSVYYAESLETIGDNLKEVKPTIFTTVPRLLEKVYDKIMLKGSELTGVKKKLFFWAHGLAARYEINKNQGVLYDLQLALANKLIFSKWREALGGNIRCIVSGGAACQVRLIRIFTAAKIPVLEGYGLTETSPVISVNKFGIEDRMFGTVGPLFDNVQVKIAEDGEILCKGPNVMLGYYKKPELTNECLTEGWYHTGDIGMMVDGRFLKITDRKKELFKTSGGKYVAPLPIENKLKESRFIEQLMVVGSERKFVSALIVPSFANLKDWCRQRGLPYATHEEVISNPKVKEHFEAIVEKYNTNFSHVEQIKRFELLPAEWSIDTGELTPKMSLKRKVVLEKYKDVIERIYSY
ncbi:MAG: long-chain fatty acid--CoA ligase [Chitinophagaceae bacterium]|nr:long-chain fatty acid--CoA ligase [Chitinophagaceae bacterium]